MNLAGCFAIGVLAGLPIVVEIVDTEEKIESFLPVIEEAIDEGLATVERVEVRFYRSGADVARRGESP